MVCANSKTKIHNYIKFGRVKITTREELLDYPSGSLISYMSHNDTLKSGGYLLKVKTDWFIFITVDLKIKYRVRFENVKKMWVGDVFKLSSDVINFSKPIQAETNFPVKIGDHIVYYGKHSYQQVRFMNTTKYKRMLAWYNYFHNK